jgi:hypothetical protein
VQRAQLPLPLRPLLLQNNRYAEELNKLQDSDELLLKEWFSHFTYLHN